MKTIYYKFVPNNYSLDYITDDPLIDTWSKYHNFNDKNTHYISYLMKKYFAGSNEIKYNQYCKPIIDNGYFNISHDNNLCVGIYDNKYSIGIDVVYINRNIDLSHLTSVFNYDESNDIYQFCRKEAYIKMIGMGLYMDLKDIKIIDNNIYYKNELQSYDIYEKTLEDYFICVIGKFDKNEIELQEFEIDKINI